VQCPRPPERLDPRPLGGTTRGSAIVSFADKISAANRERKWALFMAQVSPTPEMLVLDVGFSDKEYFPVDNYIEKHYPYPERLSALGVDTPNEFKGRYPSVAAISYSGRAFPSPTSSSRCAGPMRF
jgi:hypothetical protein